MNAFSDETLVSAYVKNAERMVPGLHDLPKMAVALLAERVPVDAHILVLGAGGGLELKVFAEAQAGWTFNGVDPSAEMLALARRTLGHLASTVNWHEGYIDTASTALCDGATCLLTLHFLTRCERLETLKQIHRRLKRGAPLIVVHHSIPKAAPDQDKWLQRNAAFAIASGMPSRKPGIFSRSRTAFPCSRRSRMSTCSARRVLQTSSCSTAPSPSRDGWRMPRELQLPR